MVATTEKQLPRIALVTGGGRGIGRAIALRLSGDGLTVAVNYRREPDAAAGVVEQIRRAGGQAEAFGGEIGSWERAVELVQAVTTTFGPVDVLVNNAGMASRGRKITDTEHDEVARMLGVHAVGAFHLCKLVLPGMRERPRGDIIMISSRGTSHMRAGGGPYNMAKAAMEALARTLANEEQCHGIRVNIVAPGLVATEMGDRLVRSKGVSSATELDEAYPFGRIARPEDVANMVAYLVSDAGSYISGQRIQIDGGGT